MARKKWQVIKNTTAEHVKGVQAGSEFYRFRRNNTFVVDDPQLARDIDKVYGRKGNQQVAVVPYTDRETRELGHTYTFGALTSPQARKNYDRIFRKKGKQHAIPHPSKEASRFQKSAKSDRQKTGNQQETGRGNPGK